MTCEKTAGELGLSLSPGQQHSSAGPDRAGPSVPGFQPPGLGDRQRLSMPPGLWCFVVVA